MTSERDGGPSPLKERFRGELNKHGYAFQCAAYNAARKAFEDQSRFNAGGWVFEVLEFPVAVQGSGTRVDFVLKLPEQNIFLLVECKRVDPALADWCFARFPIVGRNRSYDVFLAEYFERYPPLCSAGARIWHFAGQPYYEIGLEVRHPGRRGEGTGGGRSAIEDATSQVCRGLNGMVECFAGCIDLKAPTVFIPAIFTTARLWACDVDLTSDTDLETGRIEASKMADPKPIDWIFYQYHQSPGIKHQSPLQRGGSSLGALMDLEYIRTVPIVTATKIESFLKGFRPGLSDFQVIS
jgi:hypothetical protein